jgi:hypothetical protein
MKFFEKYIGIFDVLVFFILLYIFYYMTFVISTDIILHVQFIKDFALYNKPIQVNFLYYYIVYFFSFFSHKTSSLLTISVYVLTIITFLKFYIVKKIIISEINHHKNYVTASIVSFLLLFSFSLPSFFINNNYNYLLRFTPNIWHNSTTIFVMPFVILLFWISIKQLENYKTSRLYWITLLIILNIVVKPSFLFVYILVYPIFLLQKYKFQKLFWINLLPIIISLALILIEYSLIYKPSGSSEQSSITFDFFKFYYEWGGVTKGYEVFLIFVSAFLSSFLFPIVLIIKNRFLLKSVKIQFVWVALILAISISVCLIETGERMGHGNFLWQNYMISFLLFMVSSLELVKLIEKNNYNFNQYKFEIIAFLLHFFGLIYYFYIIYKTQIYF